MSSTCHTSVDLCAVRVAKLTTAGAPSAGASNGYVTDSPISLAIDITTEAGVDKTQKNGCGAVCSVLNEPDTVKGVALDAEFCQLDSYLFEHLTGADVFTSGGNAIGFQFAEIGAAPDPVCFEGWSKAWDVDEQLVSAFTTPAATYIHWVFPFTRWVQGKLTLEHDLMVCPAAAKGSQNSHITANGPFDDWPSAVASHGGITRIGGWFYDDDLPTATCDYVAVTSAPS